MGQILEIIPVIDLLNHEVVHAKRGERQHYRPIRSSLCSSSAPLDIAQALLELYPFKSLYIADLDAIQGFGSHADSIRLMLKRHPHLKLWVDAGISGLKDLQKWQSLDIDLVIGSESLVSMEAYLTLREALGPRMILSLDYGPEGFRGPQALMTRTQTWPERVIVMTLTKVGSGDGPDLDKLRDIRALNPTCKLFAAGGVRSTADLRHLETFEVSGALVASALHDGSLFETSGRQKQKRPV